MEKLVHEAQQLFGVHLTGRQVVALMTYERELLAWNEKINLTAIRDVEGVRIKHFLDSFSCVMAWRENPPQSLIDVGSGGGVPGVPLAIAMAGHHFTLAEATEKKAQFLRAASAALGLSNVTVLKSSPWRGLHMTGNLIQCSVPSWMLVGFSADFAHQGF
jgi:16S rRNA (guanine527-N7)-methyltransferase